MPSVWANAKAGGVISLRDTFPNSLDYVGIGQAHFMQFSQPCKIETQKSRKAPLMLYSSSTIPRASQKDSWSGFAILLVCAYT